jgi:tRNA 2-thiouridine synthesizing protein A
MVSEPFNQAHYELDAVGMRCPEPVMMVRLKIRDMQKGQLVYIKADDPSTIKDFASFCRFMGHTIVYSDVSRSPYQFLIEKG